MSCEKCGDRGFTEKEHGLVMVMCDCEKGQASRAEVTGIVLPEEVKDDSDSGTGQPDKPAGSPDTSQPKRTRKSKAKKKVRAKPD